MSNLKVPAPVRCAADALRVLFLATTNPLQAETLAFVLDAHGQGGVITIVSGTVDADSVLPVTECMARAAERIDRATSLVVASVRPGGCLLPGDLDRWMEASTLAAAYGVTLIEWFIITEAGVQCPRDLLGEPERWKQLRADHSTGRASLRGAEPQAGSA
ncbi:MAG: hypothetical protein K8R99_15440 [Actinomycetia bacterium]|nr:hypothetical protein [Actinomycetes bacterium]